jgi:hypothetical protein
MHPSRHTSVSGVLVSTQDSFTVYLGLTQYTSTPGIGCCYLSFVNIKRPYSDAALDAVPSVVTSGW